MRPIINRNAFRDVLNYVPEHDENVVTSMGEHLQCARHENQNVFTQDIWTVRALEYNLKRDFLKTRTPNPKPLPSTDLLKLRKTMSFGTAKMVYLLGGPIVNSTLKKI